MSDWLLIQDLLEEISELKSEIERQNQCLEQIHAFVLLLSLRNQQIQQQHWQMLHSQKRLAY